MDVVKQLPAEAEGARGGGLSSTVLRVVRGPYALRGWSIVSLAMNIVIVVTGGLVRLTGSGLGCQHGQGAPRTPTSPIPSSGCTGRSSSGTG